MKKLLTLIVALVALTTFAVPGVAQKNPPTTNSINLNSSRSNIYRLIGSADVISQAQATAILVELDKIGPANEATLRKWLAQNLNRHGVQTERIKEIIFVPADKTDKLLTIALLTNSPDEPAALAAACPKCVPVRHPLSKPNL
jgi:hypothetical protein